MNTEISEVKNVSPQDLAQGAVATKKWNELLLFIHGITSTAKPELEPAEVSYNKLFDLINLALPESSKFDQKKMIPISWGVGKNSMQGARFDATFADAYLAEVERRIAEKVKPILDEYRRRDNGLIFPTRAVRSVAELFKVRDTLLYGIPDLFFYISADGEQVIRNRIFKIIADAVMGLHQNLADGNVSLTILGHSAGSVIAHDFLYHLFGKTEMQMAVDELNPNKQQAVAEIKKLRQLKQAGKLRLRRLYTLGSPITALMIRSNSLIERMMRDVNDGLLDPRDLGLEQDASLPGPRWVNFWDVDDYASFPVEPFYKDGGGLVKDEYVDHNWDLSSDLFPTAHSMYWESQDIANYIARNF